MRVVHGHQQCRSGCKITAQSLVLSTCPISIAPVAPEPPEIAPAAEEIGHVERETLLWH